MFSLGFLAVVSVFHALPRFDNETSRVLDLFAGSGIVGLESASRGAGVGSRGHGDQDPSKLDGQKHSFFFVISLEQFLIDWNLLFCISCISLSFSCYY